MTGTRLRVKLWRAGRSCYGGLGTDVLDDAGVIVSGCPDVAEEIGWVDVAMITQELTVATAAIHDVGIELAFELGTSFGKNTGEVGFAV